MMKKERQQLKQPFQVKVAAAVFLLPLLTGRCFATPGIECKFDQTKPFHYITKERICTRPPAATGCNPDFYKDLPEDTDYPIYMYKLEIPVVDDETDCLIRFMEPGTLTATTLNQSAACIEYLMEGEKPEQSRTKCINEWFTYHENYSSQYYLSYFSSNRNLPKLKEGRYNLTLNDGTK